MNFLDEFKTGSKVNFDEVRPFYLKGQPITIYGYVTEIDGSSITICATNPPAKRGNLYKKDYKHVNLNPVQK